jgi:elongator complex protein 1
LNLGDAANLLPHLVYFTPEHRAEAVKLQDELVRFHEELRDALEVIWTKPEGSPAEDDSWAKRMELAEKAKSVDAIEKVLKPDLTSMVWVVKLLRGSKAQ